MVTLEVLPEIEGQLNIPFMEIWGFLTLDATNQAEFHLFPFVKQHEVMKFRKSISGKESLPSQIAVTTKVTLTLPPTSPRVEIDLKCDDF